VGRNYGWMFTAYGIAGIAGPQLAGYFKDSASDTAGPVVWMKPFIIAGVACLLGCIIMILLRPPKGIKKVSENNTRETKSKAA
jgi:OFA family oxalate/formate antiporter-like MFS transporter